MKQKQKSDCNANIPIKEIKSAKLGQFAKLLSIIEHEMMIREKNKVSYIFSYLVQYNTMTLLKGIYIL